MKETNIIKAQRATKLAIVIYPFIGLASALATSFIKYSSENGYTSPDIFQIWLGGIVPLTVVPGIAIWCLNEFFPRMIRTTIILFLIGIIFSIWAGEGVITALAEI